MRKEADDSRMGDGARRLRLPAGPLTRLLQPDGAFKPPLPQHKPRGAGRGGKRKRQDNEQAAEPPKVLLAHPPPNPP